MGNKEIEFYHNDHDDHDDREHEHSVIIRKLDEILRRVTELAISQEQFDTDLAGLTGAVTDLVSAVQAWQAANPATDLTAEDQSVQSAVTAVQTELQNLQPAPTPAPPVTGQ